MTNPNATRLANIGARTYAAREPDAKPAPPKSAPSRKVTPAAALQAIAQRRYGTAEPAFD
jgi:hypothetical protein